MGGSTTPLSGHETPLSQPDGCLGKAGPDAQAGKPAFAMRDPLARAEDFCSRASRAMQVSRHPMPRLALQVCLTVSISAFASADDFASSVVNYIPGTNPAAGFTNPARALGPPERFTGEGIAPGAVTPFQPAFLSTELVSIGAGGSLTLAFDPPLTDDQRNPFGIDFIVFGNSFFVDLSPPAGVVGGIVSDGGIVEASPDGSTWFTFVGAVADGSLPTLGYTDVGPYATTPGLQLTDPTLPADPALTPAVLAGLTCEELVERYEGSAGGAGFDLAAVGLSHAVAIRIRNPAGPSPNVEVDAVARVRPLPPSADINGDGTVDGLDLAHVLGAFGTPDTDADIDGSGTVDGNDLTAILAAWSA